MRTHCNPGSWLLLEASFQLIREPGGQQTIGVFDRESEQEVTLHRLLEQFLEDPAETVTGPIRITIEQAER